MPLLLAAAPLAAQTAPAGPPAERASAAALARGVAEIFGTGAAPGMAVVVVSDTGIVYLGAHGYADVEKRVPVTADTRFYIASSTKSFTALAAALLEQDGTISLEAPLSRYLPVRLAATLDPDSITLRELLTHTHGIANNGPVVVRTAFTAEHDPAMLMRLIAEHPADERRGAFRYGNIGYNVASLALDRVTGTSWKDLLAERVLRPAGMRHTTAYVSRVDPAALAQPYGGAPDGFDRLPYVKVDGNMHAAGGLVSTAADLGRWLEIHLNEGRLDGRSVFPAAVVRATHRLQARHGDSLSRWPRHGYALGWQVGTYQGDTLIHHFGGFPGFDAHVSFMPGQGIGVAVLVNGALGGTLMDEVSQYVYDVMTGRVEADSGAAARRQALGATVERFRSSLRKNRAERVARQRPLPHALAAYAGAYDSPTTGRMIWTLDGDRLRVRLGALHSVAEVMNADENALRVELLPGSGSVARFAFDGARATGVTWNGMEFRRAD